MKIKYKIASFLQVVTVCNSAFVDAPSQNIYPAAAARPAPKMKANIPACVAAGGGGAGAWLVCVAVTSSAEQQPAPAWATARCWHWAWQTPDRRENIKQQFSL